MRSPAAELRALLLSLLSLSAFWSEAKVAGAGWWPSWRLRARLRVKGPGVLPELVAGHAGAAPRPRARRAGAELARLAPFAVSARSTRRALHAWRLRAGEPCCGGVPFEIRLHTLGSVFLEYLRLLVLPGVLQTDFYYREQLGIAAGPTARSLCGLALLGLAGGALGWLLLRAGRARDRLSSATALCACALALFLGFLFPVSHLLDFGALMAERFLFAPSAGFLLLVVLRARRRSIACSVAGLRRGAASPGRRVAPGPWAARAARARMRDAVALLPRGYGPSETRRHPANLAAAGSPAAADPRVVA